jgi:hypothetical protein
LAFDRVSSCGFFKFHRLAVARRMAASMPGFGMRLYRHFERKIAAMSMA